MTPIGSFLVGAVAEKVGAPAACAIGGGCGLLLVSAVAMRWRVRRLRREGELTVAG